MTNYCRATQLTFKLQSITLCYSSAIPAHNPDDQ